MNKKSILNQFAADAINAPAAVTGGGGKCRPKCGKKGKSSKSGSRSGSGSGKC